MPIIQKSTLSKMSPIFRFYEKKKIIIITWKVLKDATFQTTGNILFEIEGFFIWIAFSIWLT